MKTIILTFSLFFMLSCNSDEPKFQSIEITPILISKGVFFNGNYNPTQHNEIFTNTTQWNDFISNVWETDPIPDEVNVDFETYKVIAAFDEPRPNGGHSIDIISVTENAENITIVVEKLLNGDATTFPTRPYHFVKIPISNKEIIFE